MAKIAQGILGPVSGKVGNVVGGTWKGVDYVRGYIIPANPKSTAQTATREKFAEIVRLTKSCLASIMRSYYSGIISGQPTTAYARNIQWNMNKMSAKDDYENFSLETQNGCWISDVDSSLSANVITATWSVETGTYGSAVPKFILIEPTASCPTKIVTAPGNLEDESATISIAGYETGKTVYAVLLLEHTDGVTGVKTYSGSINLGGFTVTP